MVRIMLARGKIMYGITVVDDVKMCTLSMMCQDTYKTIVCRRVMCSVALPYRTSDFRSKIFQVFFSNAM